MSELTFEEIVDRCVSENLDLDISNGDAAHARYLFQKLFETSKKNVIIYSKQFSNYDDDEKKVPLWGAENVVQAAKDFLSEPGRVLKLISSKSDIDGLDKNTFVRSLVEDTNRKGNIELTLPKEAISFKNFFIVSDEKAYRFALTDRETKAIANFNDKPSAQVLSKAFQGTIDNLIQSKTRKFGKTFNRADTKLSFN